MFKRNEIVTVAYDNTVRLAQVKSYNAANNTANVTIALYAASSTFTDVVLCASKLQKTLVPSNAFLHLARCLPQKDNKDCAFVVAQQKWDTVFPQYAALRANYTARETGFATIERLRKAA